MSNLGIYEITWTKSAAVLPPVPERPGLAFPVFSCDLGRVEPQTAMRAELRLAALWRDAAALEGHSRRLPHIPKPGVGNTTQSRWKGGVTRARIIAALTDEFAPVTDAFLQKVGKSRATVMENLRAMAEAGEIEAIKRAGNSPALYRVNQR